MYPFANRRLKRQTKCPSPPPPHQSGFCSPRWAPPHHTITFNYTNGFCRFKIQLKKHMILILTHSLTSGLRRKWRSPHLKVMQHGNGTVWQLNTLFHFFYIFYGTLYKWTEPFMQYFSLSYIPCSFFFFVRDFWLQVDNIIGKKWNNTDTFGLKQIKLSFLSLGLVSSSINLALLVNKLVIKILILHQMNNHKL